MDLTAYLKPSSSQSSSGFSSSSYTSSNVPSLPPQSPSATTTTNNAFFLLNTSSTTDMSDANSPTGGAALDIAPALDTVTANVVQATLNQRALTASGLPQNTDTVYQALFSPSTNREIKKARERVREQEERDALREAATLQAATLEAATLEAATLEAATLEAATLEAATLEAATLVAATLEAATLAASSPPPPLSAANVASAAAFAASTLKAQQASSRLDSPMDTDPSPPRAALSRSVHFASSPAHSSLSSTSSTSSSLLDLASAKKAVTATSGALAAKLANAATQRKIFLSRRRNSIKDHETRANESLSESCFREDHEQSMRVEVSASRFLHCSQMCVGF